MPFLIAAVSATSPAHALWDDKLEVFVQENITWDDDVFRLSDKVNCGAEIGNCRAATPTTPRARASSSTRPTACSTRPAAFTWYRANYRHFNDLDHDGYIGRAAWLWAVTPHLTGDLGYSQTRGLSSFANIQGRRPRPRHDEDGVRPTRRG